MRRVPNYDPTGDVAYNTTTAWAGLRLPTDGPEFIDASDPRYAPPLVEPDRLRGVGLDLSEMQRYLNAYYDAVLGPEKKKKPKKKIKKNYEEEWLSKRRDAENSDTGSTKATTKTESSKEGEVHSDVRPSSEGEERDSTASPWAGFTTASIGRQVDFSHADSAEFEAFRERTIGEYAARQEA